MQCSLYMSQKYSQMNVAIHGANVRLIGSKAFFALNCRQVTSDCFDLINVETDKGRQTQPYSFEIRLITHLLIDVVPNTSLDCTKC